MRLLFSFLFLSGFVFSQNIILKNVTIIPVNQEVIISDCNVYIRAGVIQKIEPSHTKQLMKGYTIIDCKNKFLMPGLADMHAHFPDKKSPIKLQEYLKLNLAAGVTTLRSMRGEFNQLALRDSINSSKKVASEIYVSYVFPEKDSLLTKDSIEKIVLHAKNNKYDFIKYLGGINETNFNYLIESANRNEISIAGHAYDRSLTKSINAGFASVEHYQPLLAAYNKDSLNFKEVLQNMKSKNVAFCPTLSFYHIFSFEFSEKTLLERNGMNYVSAKVKSAWLKEYKDALKDTKDRLKKDFESKYANVYKQQFLKFNKIFNQAVNSGVNVLLSPDDGIFNVPGFAMYEEMKLYKAAGLTNYQILKCATYNAAVYFHQEKNWGSVQVGRKANLLLLNANPLEDIENIKQVEATLLNGKYYSQKELLK
ncbi:MAG: amidohydrolase family protein [Bacteroidota bacterium]|nr:amidohydrolase family protein [Bacteroidota bacterium]MDP3144275.1 amidohydrolase family protein [Bacteroidota bacterium]